MPTALRTTGLPGRKESGWLANSRVESMGCHRHKPKIPPLLLKGILGVACGLFVIIAFGLFGPCVVFVFGLFGL